MGEIVRFPDIQERSNKTRSKTGGRVEVPDDFTVDAKSVSREVWERAELLRNSVSYDAGYDMLDIHDDVNGFIDTMFENKTPDIEQRIATVREGVQKLIQKALE